MCRLAICVIVKVWTNIAMPEGRAMEDLYTNFNKQLEGLISDVIKTLIHISKSSSGLDADLKRIKTTYTEITDLKRDALENNLRIKNIKDRAWHEDYQSRPVMEAFINEQINPFVELFQFIIELYEESKD